MPKYAIALHGGAGTIVREHMIEELEQAYLRGLEEALDAGYAILDKGGSAIDAVAEGCELLENNLLFNAGRGSVFTRSETVACSSALRPAGIDSSMAIRTSAWRKRRPVPSGRRMPVERHSSIAPVLGAMER